MDAACNDPRCPLNRRGVPHRPHGEIERDEVVDPCNDPRCALARLGMPHNSHGPMDGPAPRAAGGSGRTAAGDAAEPGAAAGRAAASGGAGEASDRASDRGSAERGGARGGGPSRGPRPGGSSTSPEEILDEAARHLRQQTGGNGAAGGRPGGGGAREAERILGATDPHGILGIPRGATVEQVKSRYRSLVKRYDAARGIIHKSAPEREKSNLIMARINGAFEALKSARTRSR